MPRPLDNLTICMCLQLRNLINLNAHVNPATTVHTASASVDPLYLAHHAR